ncbi:MAG: hypothetical protein JRF36_14435 [Deltaproteobacteria bacterium]|nr:hypothetical protein [Deltaproteobacteria bacterium]MBW2487108.1 hypothetical protein [Deltaproteobacteria bacterium]MBW2518627.1 hypothetical protein [Deltaproteobacteria bacterium]
MPESKDIQTNCFKPLLSMVRFCTFLAVVLVAGCAAGNYGYLKRSGDVTQAFETFQVYPEHRYYYLNQENNPYAVVALQNTYRLGGHMWVEFDPRSDKLEKVIGLIKFSAVSYVPPYGSYIYDHTGNQIGYWFSSLAVRGLKIDDQNQYVSIDTDRPWLRDDDRPIGGFGIGVGRGSGGGIIFGH